MSPAELALPLRRVEDLDPLLDRVGDARWVLLGEASHGTSEFYTWRAELTRRLVAERGFSFVAVEGDWPDCRIVHRSVTLAEGADADPWDALARFERWPAWMWANHEVAAFARWLRAHNAARPDGPPVGFHGIDVYSLWDSMRAVLDYLYDHEPEHVATALAAWRCFEPYDEDPQRYAYATRFVPESCEDTVVDLLARLRAEAGRTGDERFDAAQNAAVVGGAERYYRAMVRGGPDSWNVRDTHMVDTLDRLMSRYGPAATAVVWAHNTHVGDARATDMADAGMVNVGQLVRERHAGEGVVIVGFGTYAGSVVAAGRWGAPSERMPVPRARPGSVEELLHDSVGADCLLMFPGGPGRPEWLDRPLPHRAIGVVYHPEREAWGNYVPTVLGDRYDAFVHLDRTAALRPLPVRRRGAPSSRRTRPAVEAGVRAARGGRTDRDANRDEEAAMPQTVQDVMTRSPRVLDASATVQDAAQCMSEDDIGDVIVCDGGTVCGIVTDRDITVRVIAQGMDPATTRLGDICSKELVTLSPRDSEDEAVRLMRENAIRRIPIVEDGKPVGIVSLGDLAIDLDRRSVLAEVSAAPPNN